MEVSDEIIEFLRAQTSAQVEANKIKADEIALERAKVEQRQQELHLADKKLDLNRQIENRRDGRLSEVIARYADLGEQVAAVVKNGNIADVILREAFEEFSGEIRIIKRGLYALLSRDGVAVAKVKVELRAEFDQEETQELLIQQQRNLHKLRELEAKSAGQAPISLLNQIEDVQTEIQRLQAQLLP